MRTLRQIDNEIMDVSKKRAVELRANDLVSRLMSENEIIAMQANLRFGDKFREMYHILKTLEDGLEKNLCPETGREHDFWNKIKERLKAV